MSVLSQNEKKSINYLDAYQVEEGFSQDWYKQNLHYTLTNDKILIQIN